MAAPKLERVIENAIYVDDMVRACGFYEDVLGLEALTKDDRFCAYDVGGSSVFLVFRRGGTLEPATLPGGVIPPHDGSGPMHFAFGVPVDDLPAWEQRLGDNGIAIESRVNWPKGGKSIYFRDPDGHALELVTRGTWTIY